jgi:hypothetical protein
LHGELELLQKTLEKLLGHHHYFGPRLDLQLEIVHQHEHAHHLELSLDLPLVKTHHRPLGLDLGLARLGEGLEVVFG